MLLSPQFQGLNPRLPNVRQAAGAVDLAALQRRRDTLGVEQRAAESAQDGAAYADERELLMDILRHGRQVVVEQPPELRQRVADEAAALVKIYNAAASTAE